MHILPQGEAWITHFIIIVLDWEDVPEGQICLKFLGTHSLLKMWYSSFPHRPTSRKRRRRRGRNEVEGILYEGSSGIALQLMLILLLQHPLPAAGEDSATADLNQ